MQIEHKQIALQNALSTERIQKIQASASREQAAAVAGMQDHITAMGLRDSTRDELNAAREQYHQIRRHDDTSGVSARLHLRLCLGRNLRVCICTLPPSSASVPLLAMHVLTSAMTYTTHLHALPD